MNLFREYSELKKYTHQSDFQMGRYILYGAIIDMLKFNPETGDMHGDMTDAERDTWKDIDDRIKTAGNLIMSSGCQHDDVVWSFIPGRFHRDITWTWEN